MTRKALALAAAGLLAMGTTAFAQGANTPENYGSNSASGNNASNGNAAQNGSQAAQAGQSDSSMAAKPHKHKRQARNERSDGGYAAGADQSNQSSAPSSEQPANPNQ